MRPLGIPLLLLYFLCTCGPAPTLLAQVPTPTSSPLPDTRTSRLPPPLGAGGPEPLIPGNLPTGGPEPGNSTTLPQLLACIRHRHARALEAEMAALDYDQKGEWLKYLPNLGITYTVAGEPRPAVSSSSSVFYQARRDKKTRQAARLAATQRNQLLLDRELAAITRLWNRYQTAAESVAAYDEIAAIDRQLFTLYEKQYAAKEILPEAFLLKKKSFLLQELKRQEERTELSTLWHQIIDKAECL